MCKVLFAALFVLTISCIATAQDPVKVDSEHYKLEFENAQVRVLRIKMGPHEKSVMHRHPNAVAIFLTDLNGRFNFPKGAPQDISSNAGQALWTPAITHLPENTSDQPFELILVELKKPPVKKTPKKAAPATTTTNANKQ
jgi:quercetin dioxygenase-like cupin family protein